MSSQDWVELRCPCGCRLGLLILLDARRCIDRGAPCLEAEAVARLLLREWHREEWASASASEK